MRRLLMALSVFLFVSQAADAEAPDRALVAVTDPVPGTVKTLLSEGIWVVRDMGSFLLVAAEESDLGRMDALGIRRTVLDPSMEGKEFFTTGLRSAGQLSRVESFVDVLYARDRLIVFRASQADAERVVGEGLDIAKVFVRPIRLPRQAHVLPSKTAVADPLIQEMVDSVSSAFIDAAVQRLEDFETRYCTYDSCQAAADWIKAEFESFGIDSVHFHEVGGSYKPNVVATIPGKGDPSKVVVIGGHYDSTNPSNNNDAPGADDNASGTVCALECARVLSDYDFNYTLTFIAFGAEEVGLYGSEAYASDAAARGDDIIAMVSADMIGYLAGGDAMDIDIVDNTSSEWIRDAVFQSIAHYVPGFAAADGALPYGASSDHASFWAQGYDAILFFEDTDSYSPYIHTNQDLVGLSYNSSTMAENSVKTAVGLLATIAEPFKVGVSHIPLANTENSTTPYTVTAGITAAGTLNADSLLLRYSTGSGWNDVVLSATGNPDEYEAAIPAQPAGTFVDYFLVAEDTDGNRATHPAGAPASVHTFFVGTITALFEDDFETDQGWTAGAPDDDATTGLWAWCDPEGTDAQPEDDHTPSPGVKAYVTGCLAGTSLGSYDIDNGKTTLISPLFDLSGEQLVYVSYWRWYTNAAGAAPGEDYWEVQVTDDDTNWVYLENTTESAARWTEMSFRLDDFIDLTSTVRFRFIASDEINGSLVEAAVDDFTLLSYQTISTDVAERTSDAPARAALFANVPNPFNPETRISFTIPAPGRKVSLGIYDVTGRLVRALVEGESVSGASTVLWNGKDQSGRDVASGVYFYRLDAGKETFSKKLVLIR